MVGDVEEGRLSSQLELVIIVVARIRVDSPPAEKGNSLT